MFPFQFKNTALKEQALTLASAHKTAPYERLEFLGDRVLALTISDMLFRAYPKEKEGDLANRFTALVREETLAKIALMWGVDTLLITHEKDLRHNASVLADVCEALLGAYYLEEGYAAVFEIVKTFWTPLMVAEKKPPKDAKTRVQEYVQKKTMQLPIYSVVSQTGPSHHPHFVVKIEAPGLGEALGEGSSKREAEQNAAHTLLEGLTQ